MIERRPWLWMDKALFGIYTAWFSLAALVFATRPLPTNAELFKLGPILLGLLISYALPLLFWRPRYIHTTLFPLAVLLTTGTMEVAVASVTHGSVGLLILPVLIIGYMSNRYNIWWTFPVFIIGLPASAVLVMHHAYGLSVMLDMSGIGLIVFILGFGTQRMLQSHLRTKRLLEENIHQYLLIQEQNKVLEQYSRQVEALTLLEERNRLARELHDTVGHTFTSVIMGMDAVVYLLEVSPEKAKEKLEVLRLLTRKGLDEVRRHIHEIAPDDEHAALSQQLARLANEFAVHTGTNVRFHVAGEESEVPKQVQLTLVRCLQESLTNAKRHGQAQSINVRLEYGAESVTLAIEDDGVGADQVEPGFGLSAMKDRLDALQGFLAVSSTPGAGAAVRCTIPVARKQEAALPSRSS